MLKNLKQSIRSWVIIALLVVGCLSIAAVILLLFLSLHEESFSLTRPLVFSIIGFVSVSVALVSFFLSSCTLTDRQLAMHKRLLEFIPTVTALASHLSNAATEIRHLAQTQREGAIRQSAAVAETRETLSQTVHSAIEITESADKVHANAQSTLESNERASSLLLTLKARLNAIEHTVEQLKMIAAKSEVLALNASLEGTKAGESGKGFSLVAAQIQKLAEGIASLLKEIDSHTEEIANAAIATDDTLQIATIDATSTTEEGKTIARITRHQLAATKQVETAVNDIREITESMAEGSTQTFESTKTLENLAEELLRFMEEIELW